MNRKNQTSMVEKVAKAIAYNGLESGSPHKPNWRNYVDEAKAAIAAMRNPSEAILKKAARNGIPNIDYYEGSAEEYMDDMLDMFLDAALEEEDE